MSDAFTADVAALAHVLKERESGRWLLCTESAYGCAVGLFALWQTGSTAVLPPNTEAGSLRELSQGVRGLLSDRAEQLSGLPHLPVLGWVSASTPAWRELDPSATVLELCTSGSTGARKLVPKALHQLEAEIEELERRLGAACGSACVFGTVSHQHIYGLLFRVLWPLCAGRVFIDQQIADPSEIANELGKADAAILVSSPAHLKRLPELIDLNRLRLICKEVFSSGGPLDASTARRYEQDLGSAPLEVLGSTETGGIAWRRQSSAGSLAAWTPFERTHVEARDGRLYVRSPQAGATNGIATGDDIELLADGRFLLLGRADRIVKLFDERVSLAELESRLCAHPAVDAAAALTIERNGTLRIAVVVVLRPEGQHRLREQGKQALINRLQAHLREYFRPTALPRSWRFVERLPEDAQGKTSLQSLEALFPAGTQTRAARLVTRGLESDREFEVELEVPSDLWCLPGHFEGYPVVPGVVQLQWVLDWVGSWTGSQPSLRVLEALKFKRILTAGTQFRLRLERTSDQEKLRFRL